MKQFTKISLVTILSFIGVILTVMFRDVVFQAVGPAIGLFENGQPTPVAGTTVLFLWGMLVAMLPLLAVRLKWPARFHFQIRNDVNWKTVSPAIVAIIWAMSPQLWDTIKALPTAGFTTIYHNFMDGFQPGFFEELVVRGAVLMAFLFAMNRGKYQALGAALGSSIIFGLFHFINLTGGQPLGDTIQQVVYATGFGLVFVAIYYRTNSLWIPMILHGLTDFTGDFQVGTAGEGWLDMVIYILPFTLIALWMLRPSMNDYNLKSFPEVNDPSLK